MVYYISLIILAIAILVNILLDRQKIISILSEKQANIDGLKEQVNTDSKKIDDLQNRLVYQAGINNIIVATLDEKNTKVVQDKIEILKITQRSDLN